MLARYNTMLVVVDVQEKLARAMYEKEELIKNITRLVTGATLLKVPIIWLEQNPEGLGKTVPEIAALMPDLQPITKMCFSALDSEEFQKEIARLHRKNALLCGIEAHVCVYQTAKALLTHGHDPFVVADAVSSRTLANKQIALNRIQEAGGRIVSTEMVLFEILKTAEAPEFKQILKLIV